MRSVNSVSRLAAIKNINLCILVVPDHAVMEAAIQYLTGEISRYIKKTNGTHSLLVIEQIIKSA